MFPTRSLYYMYCTLPTLYMWNHAVNFTNYILKLENQTKAFMSNVSPCQWARELVTHLVAALHTLWWGLLVYSVLSNRVNRSFFSRMVGGFWATPPPEHGGDPYWCCIAGVFCQACPSHDKEEVASQSLSNSSLLVKSSQQWQLWEVVGLKWKDMTTAQKLWLATPQFHKLQSEFSILHFLTLYLQ